MATMTMVLIVLTEAATFQVNEEDTQTPATLPNVFDTGPPPWSYYQWWRPLGVVFDRDTVLEIQRRIDAVPVTQTSDIDLAETLGELKSSSFLFPVLATKAEKGVQILSGILKNYRNGGRLDDRWLLTIATLGRIAAPESQQTLEDELQRLLAEYDFDLSGPTPVVEAYIPVVDALFACMAGRGTLTVKEIERLARVLRRREALAWTLSLEWSRAFMAEEGTLQLLRESLAGCTDEDLRGAMDEKASSDRLGGIIRFLIWPKDNWPLSRALLKDSLSQRASLRHFLSTHYLGIVTLDAERKGGHFVIDQDVVEELLSVDPPTYRGLAKTCWILSQYQDSMHSPRWEAFLAKHAAHLDERDRASAQYTVDRVFGRVELPAGVKISYDRIEPPITKDQPGVHILGFRRAGGRHPTITVPEPKQD